MPYNKTMLKQLPKERFLEEFKKLFLKSKKPSLGLKVLWDLGVFDTVFPEFKDFKTTKEDPVYHGEGTTYVHTLLAVNEAVRVCRENNLNEEDSFTIILAVFCHDLGKPLTTKVDIESGRCRARGHEEAGVEPTTSFLEKLGVDNKTKDKIISLVREHLKPSILVKAGAKSGAFRKLSKRLFPATIRELAFVSEADHSGRKNFFRHGNECERKFVEIASKLNIVDNVPTNAITGKELKNLGFVPGPRFGELINFANKLRDDGVCREKIFEALLENK